MDKAPTDAKPADKKGKRRRRGGKLSRLTIDEDRIIEACVPDGSRFKGYEDYVVQELIPRPHVVRYRRQRWLSPDGRMVVAPLPAGIAGHFGLGLRRFVLAQYHRGQVSVPRLTGLLRDIGVDISERQVVRLLNGRKEGFTAEGRDVLRAGLETARWITVDDTGARHKVANGVCTASRRPPLRLVRHDAFEEPAQLSFAARGRPRGLRGQRGGAGLHAQASPRRTGDRSSGGAREQAVRGRGGVDGPSGGPRDHRAQGPSGPGEDRHRGGAVGQRGFARLNCRIR